MHTRRPLQISVWTMLLGSTILTGYFAGYNTGGRQKTALVDSRKDVYAKSYGVRDMVRNTSNVHGDLRKIIAIIKQNVEPESWLRAGVGALPYDTDQSIIIQQTEDVHGKINDLLTYLRNTQCAPEVEVVIGLNYSTHSSEAHSSTPVIQIWHLSPPPVDSAG